ncbi:hypothetical protein [Nocardia thailandica]|uniref:hypothetical protein n=1 Tax=Nocardia thailandica TaxID=257275 RepID=UPI0002E55015|nr:hypothetical protein [Nocardia thailandica]
MSGREVISSVSFGHQPPPSSDYVETDTGQLVTPEFLSLLQQTLTGRLAEHKPDETLDPQVRALAEELSIIHLPEWYSEVGRKLADPTVTSIKQATRVAEYLVKRGVRVHPDLEEIRWVPTPMGPPGAFDTGMHITRDVNGEWPLPDPESFYDLEEIQVKQTEEGNWSATHPRGLSTEAPTKTDAYAAMVDQLRQRIERARRSSGE